jgi:hypothetical protein
MLESACRPTRPHGRSLLAGGAHPAIARPRRTARTHACQPRRGERAAAHSHDPGRQSAGRRERDNREIDPVADTNRGQRGRKQANSPHPRPHHTRQVSSAPENGDGQHTPRPPRHRSLTRGQRKNDTIAKENPQEEKDDRHAADLPRTLPVRLPGTQHTPRVSSAPGDRDRQHTPSPPWCRSLTRAVTRPEPAESGTTS